MSYPLAPPPLPPPSLSPPLPPPSLPLHLLLYIIITKNFEFYFFNLLEFNCYFSLSRYAIAKFYDFPFVTHSPHLTPTTSGGGHPI